MSLHCLQTVPGASGGICGPAGPISLPAVFSSLVSSMGTMDVTGRRIGDMRSDGVHGSLMTTGMATAPQFQLQRTSRGWVRRKKKIPSDINRGARTGVKERRLVSSPFRIPLVGLCSSLPHARCADL